MGLKTRIQWNDGVQLEIGNAKARSRFGLGTTPSGLFKLDDGTTSGQANDVFEKVFTIAPGATLQIDLKGGSGEVNLLNQALAFTKVKGIEIILATAPAAGVSLQVGPQGITNAAQLWFQAATANFWHEVRDRIAVFDRAVGWTIDNTHKILGLKNPGAADVSGWLRVIGTK